MLRTVKYGDARMIVDFLTREAGRVSVACRLAKTGRGRVKSQFFQPMTLLDIEVDYRKTAQLQHLKDIQIAYPLVSVPFDAYKLSISLFLSEFLVYATRDEQHNVPLYDFIEKSLLWLDSAQQAYANFHLVFMMRLTLFIGFYPNMEDYREGMWFDLREGTFTSLRPLHPDCLEPREASQMRMLMRMTFENMHVFRMNHDDRNRCTETILSYYRLHVPNFPELKSLEVVRSLF